MRVSEDGITMLWVNEFAIGPPPGPVPRAGPNSKALFVLCVKVTLVEQDVRPVKKATLPE